MRNFFSRLRSAFRRFRAAAGHTVVGNCHCCDRRTRNPLNDWS